MSSYAKLNLTRSCGHTEAVIFDVYDDFENLYHKQLKLPCLDCLLKESSKPVEIVARPQQDDLRIDEDVTLPVQTEDTKSEQQTKVYIPKSLRANMVKSLKTMDLATKKFIYEDMEHDNTNEKSDSIPAQFEKMSEDERRPFLIELWAKHRMLKNVAKVLNTSNKMAWHHMNQRNITKETIHSYIKNMAKNDPNVIPWSVFKTKTLEDKYNILLQLMVKYHTSYMVAKIMDTNQSNISKNCVAFGITKEFLDAYTQKMGSES